MNLVSVCAWSLIVSFCAHEKACKWRAVFDKCSSCKTGKIHRRRRTGIWPISAASVVFQFQLQYPKPLMKKLLNPTREIRSYQVQKRFPIFPETLSVFFLWKEMNL